MAGLTSTNLQAFLAAGVEGLALVDLSLSALQDAFSSALAAPDGQQRILLLAADVSDEESVISYVSRTVERFGRLDISVQNAGIAQQPISIMEQDVDGWDRVMRVNVRGRE